jgi:hypothetical protein
MSILCFTTVIIIIIIMIIITLDIVFTPGHAVVYLVEALCYKQEGRGFKTRWEFICFNLPNRSSRTRPPAAYSAPNRNGYQKQEKMFLRRTWPARNADSLTAVCEPIV